jgi:hypothetical protein
MVTASQMLLNIYIFCFLNLELLGDGPMIESVRVEIFILFFGDRPTANMVWSFFFHELKSINILGSNQLRINVSVSYYCLPTDPMRPQWRSSKSKIWLLLLILTAAGLIKNTFSESFQSALVAPFDIFYSGRNRSFANLFPNLWFRLFFSLISSFHEEVKMIKFYLLDICIC